MCASCRGRRVSHKLQMASSKRDMLRFQVCAFGTRLCGRQMGRRAVCPLRGGPIIVEVHGGICVNHVQNEVRRELHNRWYAEQCPQYSYHRHRELVDHKQCIGHFWWASIDLQTFGKTPVHSKDAFRTLGSYYVTADCDLQAVLRSKRSCDTRGAGPPWDHGQGKLAICWFCGVVGTNC